MHARQGDGLATAPARVAVRPCQDAAPAGRPGRPGHTGRRACLGAILAVFGAMAWAWAQGAPLPGPRACAEWAASSAARQSPTRFSALRAACAGQGLTPPDARTAPRPDPRALPGWDVPIPLDPPGTSETEPVAAVPGFSGRSGVAGPGPARSPSARAVALAPLVDATARRHDIDPLLLHAIAHVESRHRSDARSPAGALGLMQVMPGTGERFGVRDPRHLQQAATSLEVGAGYLKWLQRRFRNDLTLVIAAYNAGEGAVERHGLRIPPFPETQAYVRAVLSEYQRLRWIAQSLPPPAPTTDGTL